MRQNKEAVYQLYQKGRNFYNTREIIEIDLQLMSKKSFFDKSPFLPEVIQFFAF
jgi:hypothetical protein